MWTKKISLKNINPWDAGILVILMLFFLLTSWFHSGVLVGGLDEYFKLTFVLAMDGPEYFLPWNGNGGAFYGHPGLMNFLYYCWSEVFGNSMLAVRHFCLLFSTLTLLSFYGFLIREIQRPRAFFATLAALSLPMLQVQSILFLNQLGCFFWIFLSLMAYQRKQWVLFLLFSLLGFAWLESALSFVGAVVVWEVFKGFKNSSLNFKALASCLLVFAGVVGFFYSKSLSGAPDGHTTQEFVLNKLRNPSTIFLEVDYNFLFLSRYRTFIENGIAIATLPLVCLVAIPLYRRRKIPFSDGFASLFIGSLGILFFGSFLSTHPGGADTYALFFFLFAWLFGCVPESRMQNTIAVALVAIFTVSSAVRLSAAEMSWTQTTFFEYTNQREFENIRTALISLPGPMNCAYDQGAFTPLFCHPFFGFFAENMISVSGKLEQDVVHTVMPPKDESWMYRGMRDQDYYVEEKIPLGVAFYTDLVLYAFRRIPSDP